MLDFKRFEFEDLAVLSRYLPRYGSGDCDMTVPSLFTRMEQRELTFCEVDNHLICERNLLNVPSRVIIMPLGEGELDASIWRALQERARELDQPLIFYGVVDEASAILTQAYPSCTLKVEDNPARWDYVYLTDDFIRLEGSRFHSKRNFIKRFYKARPNATFEFFSASSFDACREFLQRWYDEKEADEELQKESRVIERMFEYYDKLDIYGGFLHDNGEVLGLTYGARCRCDMISVHIEKATRTVPGAYPALSQAFAQTLPLCIKYLNREEDLGIPGLRKAKEDWHPFSRVKKGIIEVC